ncbi:MAG: HAD-IA family hydrolase [Ornithinimicrobium sp.]
MLRWPVVLFDLDGTLADTVDLIVASYDHALQEVLAVSMSRNEVRTWIGRPLHDAIIDTFPTQADRVDEVVTAYRRWNLAHHDEMIQRVPGMDLLLTELATAGAAMGVVTSKLNETAARGLKAVGLDGAIEIVAGQDQTNKHKPHPEPLLYAARILGVDPADCVYVGDATVDLQAAHAAGMASIGVTWGAGERANLEAEVPAAVVDDVDDLTAVLWAKPAPTDA